MKEGQSGVEKDGSGVEKDGVGWRKMRVWVEK